MTQAERPRSSSFFAHVLPQYLFFIFRFDPNRPGSLDPSPERYAGKKVVVRGFVRTRFEGSAIFLHRDYDRLFMTREALWLDFPASWGRNWVNAEGKQFDGTYCLIAGTFSTNNHGHFGNYAGAIDDVIRIAVIESMRQMRR